MDGLVKLIWAFWIIVIVGIVIAAITCFPWLLLLAILIIIIGVVTALVNSSEAKINKKKSAINDKKEVREKTFDSNKVAEYDNAISKTVPELSMDNGASPSPYDSEPCQPLNKELEYFDMLTGTQFKDLVEKHFLTNNYTVKRISPRMNSIDFLIKKDGIITAVATKHTFDLIQRTYVSNVIESAKKYKNISSIMIITNSSYFVSQAQKLAAENYVILWDRNVLKYNIGDLK